MLTTSVLSSVAESRFLGESAALAAAFLWAAATLMFGRLGRQLSPLLLNIVKGVFAVGLILITLTLQQLNEVAPAIAFELPLKATIYLLLSGAVGIGIGDTAYFATINALGARRALLLETLAPPVAAVLAWSFLSERLSVTAIAGIGLTLVGVAWVISERVPEKDQGLKVEPVDRPSAVWASLGVAMLAVFSQASGAVLSRAALADTAIAPLWSSLLRLVAGLVCMGLIALLRPQQLGAYGQISSDSLSQTNNTRTWQNRWQASLLALRRPRLMGGIALAAFFGTYLGIWLQQISLKYTAAGIAQALLATSPLFVLPMAAFLGDRISLRSILGAAVALSGVWILLAN